MLKRLAVLVLFAIVLPVHGEKESPKAGSDKTTGNSSQNPSGTPLGTVTCVVKQEGTAIECQWPESKPKSYFQRFASPENLPNIGLFFIGLGGVAAAVITFLMIKRQADLMKEQNDLTMNERRARIGTDVENTLIVESEGIDLRHLIAILKVRNTGASRAYIRRTNGRLITRLPGEVPREYEYYGLGLPDQFLDPNLEPTPVKIYMFPDSITIRAFAESLEQAKFSLHLTGFIEYETLGMCWRRDFGYDWMPTSHSSPFDDGYEIEVIDNSSMSDKIRVGYGYWQPNEEQNKPEYPISCKPSDGTTAN